MTNKRNPRAVCSRLGLGLFTMLLVWILGLSGLTIIAGIVSPESLTNVTLLFLLNDVGLYCLGVPLYLVIMHFAVPDGPEEAKPRSKPFSAAKFILLIIFCLGAMNLFGFISNFFTMLVESIKGRSVVDNFAGVESLSLLSMIFFGACIPAVGEEFLFRYMILKKMRGGGDRNFIFFSALCFALFHLNIGQALYAFVVGLALAWVYVRTGRLWFSILAHFILNVCGMILLPNLGDYNIALYLTLVGLLIVGAGIIFGVSLKKVWRGLEPPSESGWPGKAPAANHDFAYGSAYGYTAPYYGYGYYDQYGYYHNMHPYYYQYPVQYSYYYPASPYTAQPAPYYPPTAGAYPAQPQGMYGQQPPPPAYNTPVSSQPAGQSSLSAEPYPPPVSTGSLNPAVAASEESKPFVYKSSSKQFVDNKKRQVFTPQAAAQTSTTPPAPTQRPAPSPVAQNGYIYASYPYGYTIYSDMPQTDSQRYNVSFKPPTKGVLYGNVGMVLYLVLTGLMIIFNLLA